MSAEKEVDWGKLDALLQFKVTLEHCAHELGMHHNTLRRHVQETKGMDFKEYAKLRLSTTGRKLQQKAIELALKGDKLMIIWCLKNIDGWSDKIEQKVTDDKPEIKLAYPEP